MLGFFLHLSQYQAKTGEQLVHKNTEKHKLLDWKNVSKII